MKLHFIKNYDKKNDFILINKNFKNIVKSNIKDTIKKIKFFSFFFFINFSFHFLINKNRFVRIKKIKKINKNSKRHVLTIKKIKFITFDLNIYNEKITNIITKMKYVSNSQYNFIFTNLLYRKNCKVKHDTKIYIMLNIDNDNIFIIDII